MKLIVDIGIDELNENLFQMAVMENDTGSTFCHVFGKTPDECSDRAEELVRAFNEFED